MRFPQAIALSGILATFAASLSAQVAVQRTIVINPDGLSETTQREPIMTPPASPVVRYSDAFAPPESLWTFGHVSSVPSSVAFSRATESAWVAEDLNQQRLHRFAITGTGVPLATFTAPSSSEVVADAAEDADIAVFGVETGNVSIRAYNSAGSLWTFNVPSPYVDIDAETLRVSRDGLIVCCAAKNPGPPESARLYILNGTNGALLRWWDYPSRLEGIDLTDDGSRCLATQGANGRLIDTATATEIFTGSVTGMGGYARISGNGDVIAMGGFNLRVYVKSGSTYTQRLNYTATNHFFDRVAVSQDGSTVATMSVNYTNYLQTATRVFDVASQALLGQYPTSGTGSYQDAPSAAAVSDDGSVVAVASWGTADNAHPEVLVFDRTVNLIASIDTGGSVFTLDLSGDGVYVIAGNYAQHANTMGSGGEVTCYHVRTPVLPRVVYVDRDSAPGGDGTSWSAAYSSLTTALASAQAGDEVWVAEGVYRPTGPGGDRSLSFNLPSGVKLYGGFKGVTPAPPDLPTGETDRSQRNPSPETNNTVLSGDLNGNDGAGFTNNAENSYRVISAVNSAAATTLDGFTISGANSNSGSYPTYNGGGLYTSSSALSVANCRFLSNLARCGGGMYNDRGGPTVKNCVFRGNRATTSGGGIYDWRSGSGLKLTDCTFDANLADSYGAGLYNDGSVTTAVPAAIERCTFVANNSGYWAGAIYNWIASPSITDCGFFGNSAVNAGGAIYNEGTTVTPARGADPTLINCAFSGNSAPGNAGGAMRTWIGTATVINCTFSENSSSNGGGLEVAYLGYATVKNCVFWRNSDTSGMDESAQIHLGGIGTLTMTYTNLQGLSTYAGTGNLGTDPLLRDPNGADNIPGTLDDNLRLRYPSPCIDSGSDAALPASVTTDLAGKPRRQDGNIDSTIVVDRGALEYEFAIAGDFNHDRDVDDDDVNAFRACGSGPAIPVGTGCEAKDMDGDGDADQDDFGVIQRCYSGAGVIGNPACGD